MYGAWDVNVAHAPEEHTGVPDLMTAAKTVALLIADWWHGGVDSRKAVGRRGSLTSGRNWFSTPRRWRCGGGDRPRATSAIQTARRGDAHAGFIGLHRGRLAAVLVE
jgi:hypothetical protein